MTSSPVFSRPIPVRERADGTIEYLPALSWVQEDSMPRREQQQPVADEAPAAAEEEPIAPSPASVMAMATLRLADSTQATPLDGRVWYDLLTTDGGEGGE